MIILNLKTYERSLDKALFLVDTANEIVEETGMHIVVCPPCVFLKDAAERHSEIFAQNVDVSIPGAHTGELPVEALKILKVKGSLVNHSEKKLDIEKVKLTIDRLHSNALESLACASTLDEIGKITHFSPTYLAIEPPELIGSGISVSTAKPEIVSESVKRITSLNDKVIPLCGAGISNKKDVREALKLGSKGVLLSSAFVNAPDPKEFLKELVSVF